MTEYRQKQALTVIEITEEFLRSGLSAKGGFCREQYCLLGVSWPPPKGWKRAILGRFIDVADAQAFEEIGLMRRATGTEKVAKPVNSTMQSKASTLWLYVLELANNNFYVGMTRNVEERFRKHSAGSGSHWTALHQPLRLIRSADTGLTLEKETAPIEDALTVQMMEQFGRERVRGGKYCAIDQAQVDAALLSHGHWANIERATLHRGRYELQDNWQDALNNVIKRAVQYYESLLPNLRSEFFSVLYRLTHYQFWHTDFDAGLDSAYWDENGILPVLLSFRDNLAIASNCQDAFCVLNGAMNRSRRNGPSFHHLFLFGWVAFVPSATAAQAAKIEYWLGALPVERDRRYDEFTAILLPQMRYLLRS